MNTTTEEPAINFEGLEFLNLKQAARAFNCSPRHLQHEISRGNLKGFKIANKLMMRKKDLEKWALSKCIKHAR